ncbi:sigma-70 family RNA polymerase sigma factor [Phocaeicola barnesiae]|mgnify:CR=1 FL=1|uniref:RNA polymerase sigma factor n=1 Tax=Phocaeicola barnesiae TaxID=376804 RepID=UPI0025A34D2F|nr:sigma-70 family RNA polymerase sigma factor [Phocaeicola barnesiae]MDM8240855.1 sigma-70 family RNA polymerase sigma factor [Phocaeicola barnesiae]
MRLSFHWNKRNADSSLPETMIREEGVEQLYAHYRPLFIGYIRKRYQLEEEVASDIYHDSFLLMMDNIRTGKYQQQDASLLTYLLGIGKHLVLKRFQKEDKLPLVAEWVSELLPDTDWKYAQEEAYRLVSEDDSVCNRILRFFYWDRLSMAEIAERLEYQSAEVAKSKKNSCLRRFSFELKRRLEGKDIFYKLKK